MAKQEHLDILAKGVEEWNRWRKAVGESGPDPSGVDLREANLRDDAEITDQ